jgi:hypothetical protein
MEKEGLRVQRVEWRNYRKTGATKRAAMFKGLAVFRKFIPGFIT